MSNTSLTGTTGTAGSSLGAGGGTSTAGLSDWASPYITDYLGRAQALSNTPYQTYGGPLTAGESSLQTQAFQGIGNLTVGNRGTYTPVGGSFTDAGISNQYMSPYMQNVVDVQSQQAKRQADIAAQTQQAQAARSGAFGGGRDAIMRSQSNAELQRNLAGIQATGSQNAFEQAMAQYNTEQGRKIQEAQFGADFGLKGLAAEQGVIDQMARLGGTQRDIDQQGITADFEEFNRQRKHPYEQIQFQRDMISGLPIGSVENTPAQLSGIAQLISSVGGIDKLLRATGQKDLATLLQSFGLDFGGEPV